jgi:hypothetical protein
LAPSRFWCLAPGCTASILTLSPISSCFPLQKASAISFRDTQIIQGNRLISRSSTKSHLQSPLWNIHRFLGLRPDYF